MEKPGAFVLGLLLNPSPILIISWDLAHQDIQGSPEDERPLGCICSYATAESREMELKAAAFSRVIKQFYQGGGGGGNLLMRKTKVDIRK